MKKLKFIDLDFLLNELFKTIDQEVDWFILRIQTPPSPLHDYYNAQFETKRLERMEKARELYERFS